MKINRLNNNESPCFYSKDFNESNIKLLNSLLIKYNLNTLNLRNESINKGLTISLTNDRMFTIQINYSEKLRGYKNILDFFNRVTL